MTATALTDRTAARLLMISFFLPDRLQVFAVFAAVLFLAARAVYTRQPVARAALIAAAIASSLYLPYLVALPITAPLFRDQLLMLCEHKASLLFVPLLFAIAGPVFRGIIAGELRYFMYGCFTSCLAGNAVFIYHYATGGVTTLSHVSYRIGIEQATGIHPTYMSMFLGFSMCILLLTASGALSQRRLLKHALFYTMAVLLLALLAKSALIAMGIILLHVAITRRHTLYASRYQLAGLAAVITFACFFIPFVGQRAHEVLSYIGIGKASNITDNSVYVRKAIWDIDTGLLRHNWLTGVGPARVQHLLQQRYFFLSLAHGSNTGYYDPHSEYLSEWLSFGIAGILLLAGVLAYHFRRAVRAGNTLYLYCLILLCITFFTETVLSRQEGVLFYVIFTSLFCLQAGRRATAGITT